MNNKGFSLIELLAVIIIIGIVALIAVPSVSQYINKASDTSYSSYERSMEDAAKNMIMDCETDLTLNCNLKLPYTTTTTTTIKLKILVNEGYIDKMKDPQSNAECNTETSYVEITLPKANTAEYKYKACLYCGDYVTVGC